MLSSEFESDSSDIEDESSVDETDDNVIDLNTPVNINVNEYYNYTMVKVNGCRSLHSWIMVLV